MKIRLKRLMNSQSKMYTTYFKIGQRNKQKLENSFQKILYISVNISIKYLKQ